MNTKQINSKLIKEIKKFFLKNKKKNAVLGISGGIDSALCATLLVKALGPKNITALLMPAFHLTSKQNTMDAKKLVVLLGINYFTVPIDRFIAPFSHLAWKQSKRALQNLFARQRAVILYSFANTKNAIVCGTGNKSEILLGYFTKYGDGAADFFPIGDLFKTQVLQLAKYHKLPKEIIEKTPTAELFLGQSDEKDLGAKYSEIDKILFLKIKNQTTAQIQKKGHKKKIVQNILKKVNESKHKRETPTIIKIN